MLYSSDVTDKYATTTTVTKTQVDSNEQQTRIARTKGCFFFGWTAHFFFSPPGQTKACSAGQKVPGPSPGRG